MALGDSITAGFAMQDLPLEYRGSVYSTGAPSAQQHKKACFSGEAFFFFLFFGSVSKHASPRSPDATAKPSLVSSPWRILTPAPLPGGDPNALTIGNFLSNYNADIKGRATGRPAQGQSPAAHRDARHCATRCAAACSFHLGPGLHLDPGGCPMTPTSPPLVSRLRHNHSPDQARQGPQLCRQRGARARRARPDPPPCREAQHHRVPPPAGRMEALGALHR